MHTVVIKNIFVEYMPPPFREGKDFCLFCSLMFLKYLEQFVKHNRRSINTVELIMCHDVRDFVFVHPP